MNSVNEIGASQFVDAQELSSEICNILIDKGYRVVKVNKALLAEEARRAELARIESEVENKQLITALKQWRRVQAELEKVPVYLVLSQKTLLLIAASAPSTAEELESLPGFGPVKAERYTKEILRVVSECIEEAS